MPSLRAPSSVQINEEGMKDNDAGENLGANDEDLSQNGEDLQQQTSTKHGGDSAQSLGQSSSDHAPGESAYSTNQASSRTRSSSGRSNSRSIQSLSAPTASDHVSQAASGGSAAPNLSPGSSASTAPVSPPVAQRTRLQHGKVMTKIRTNGTIPYGSLSASGEPDGLQDALEDKYWKKAMDEEYDALMRNKTWHLVPLSTEDGTKYMSIVGALQYLTLT